MWTPPSLVGKGVGGLGPNNLIQMGSSCPLKESGFVCRIAVMSDPLRLLKPLLSSKDIQRRISELAREIDEAYKDASILVLGIMKGSVHFLSDLTRELQIDHTIDFIRVSTYREGSSPSPSPKVETWEGFDLQNKDVLVVDDILDRGFTSQAVSDYLAGQSPKSVRWAVLLAKEGALKRTGIQPDFLGFEIPDVWVVGYGMDYDERFRHLRDICVMET